jgi:hypothetical protein
MINARSARRAMAFDLLGWQSFTPVEAAALAFVVGAVVAGAVLHVPVGGFLWTSLMLSSALAVFSFGVVRVTRMDPVLGRWLAGVSLTFCIYAALPPWLDAIAGPPIDPILRRTEEMVFGTTLAQAVAPYVSDRWTIFFALAYSIHVPLFFISPLLHWRAGRRGRAERLLLTLALSMYVGFVGYAIFPAYGPVGDPAGLPSLTSNLATDTVANYGVALGTFPSLHAGVSSAVAIDAWRTSRRWGLIFTLAAALVWASTIYLRYHWVPDLLAGLALVVLCDALARQLLAHWRRGRLA